MGEGLSRGGSVLETDRLLLRELEIGDLDFVAAMLAHPEVMRFWPKRYSREEATGWIERQRDRYSTRGYGYWLAVEKSTGAPVGQAGVLAQEVVGKDEAGLGYMIHHPFWYRGFATEAALACRDYTFGVLGRARVIALVRPENRASRGVVSKLGMRVAGSTTHAGFEHLIFSARRPTSFERE